MTREKEIVGGDIKKAEAIIKRVEAIEKEILDLISPGGPTTIGMSSSQHEALKAAVSCRSQLVEFINSSNSELHYLDFVERDDAKKEKATA